MTKNAAYIAGLLVAATRPGQVKRAFMAPLPQYATSVMDQLTGQPVHPLMVAFARQRGMLPPSWKVTKTKTGIKWGPPERGPAPKPAHE